MRVEYEKFTIFSRHRGPVSETVQNRTTVTIIKYKWLIGSRIRPFGWCQNQRPWMILNGRYALYYRKDASFGAHHKNLNEGRPILPAAKMLANDCTFLAMWYLCVYSLRFPGERASNDTVRLSSTNLRHWL